MGDSFPKSTRQSQMPGHTYAEGGRRVESVVSQSGGPGVNHSNLPARLRYQRAFQSSNHFFDFGKESPMAPPITESYLQKANVLRSTFFGRYLENDLMITIRTNGEGLKHWPKHGVHFPDSLRYHHVFSRLLKRLTWTFW